MLALLTVHASAAAERGFLFLVESADGGRVGCVVGTIHTHEATNEFRDKFIENCGSRGQVVIIEVAGHTSEEAANTELLQIRALVSAQVPEKVRTEQMAVIRAHEATLTRLGLDPNALGKQAIWQSAFSVGLTDMARFLPPKRLSMEQQLISSLSGPARSKVVGLERTIDQLTPYANLGYGDQLYMLNRALSNLRSERTRHFLTRLSAAWRSGDHDRVLPALDSYAQTDRERSLSRRTILSRNGSLVSALQRTLLAEGRPFTLLIGATHLGTPTGVLASLRNAGYRVRQI